MMRLPPEDTVLLVDTRRHWEPLRGSCVLLTGGTGFVGRWLVSAFVHANRAHGLGARLELLTRHASAYARSCPELAGDESVTLVEGDVCSIDLSSHRYTHVIHGATPTVSDIAASRPEDVYSSIVTGARRMLDLATASEARRFLLLSSGAVYRPRPPAGGYDETCPRGPVWPEERSPYDAGKRAAEDLAWDSPGAKRHVTVARMFAFVGPFLPLDQHFAMGNFLGVAVRDESLVVHGDGSPVRSYLYAADMATWLWSMLLDERAAGTTYNVGSELPVSILEAARLVATESGLDLAVEVRGCTEAGSRTWYVPSTRRARDELGLSETVPLRTAVRRTLRWLRSTATAGGYG